MTFFKRNFGNEVALSQIDTLSNSEASGSLSLDYGLTSTRRHQVPRDWPSPVTRFLAPSKPAPKPSAMRGLPRSSNPPLSAA